MIVGMDGNGHSPWWGPATTTTNPVGELIENLILDLDLEIINHTNCPPTFVSDMGHTTWIDLTLGTRSGAFVCSRLEGGHGLSHRIQSHGHIFSHIL